MEVDVQTVADNAYIAYRSLKGRLVNELAPPEIDPLCALLLRKIWMNGSSIGIAHLRIELALPRSTLSTALRRAEDRGLIRRYPNVVDARYVDAALTHAGQFVATSVTDVIADLEVDVHEAAGGPARYGFSRVARMLAAMEDEPDAYRPLLEAEGIEGEDEAEGLEGELD
jgi:DNA-binding MarR family transcriptional regulator